MVHCSPSLYPPPTLVDNSCGSASSMVQIQIEVTRKWLFFCDQMLGSNVKALGESSTVLQRVWLLRDLSPHSLLPPLLPRIRIVLAASTVSITQTGPRSPSSWRRLGQIGRRSDERWGKCEISSPWTQGFKPGRLRVMTSVLSLSRQCNGQLQFVGSVKHHECYVSSYNVYAATSA